MSVDKVDKTLKIKIQNNGYFNAVNLKIEACIVDNEFTYHFKVDKEDFLILPPKKDKNKSNYFRFFIIDSFADSAKKYDYDSLFSELTNTDNRTHLRVRIHACHEYSGFGKAFEQKFKWTIKGVVQID